MLHDVDPTHYSNTDVFNVFQAPAPRTPPPLGRDAALRELHAAFAAPTVSAGGIVCVCVTGESGVGKTTLAAHYLSTVALPWQPRDNDVNSGGEGSTRHRDEGHVYYDRVVWLHAGAEPAALDAQFITILARFGGNYLGPVPTAGRDARQWMWDFFANRRAPVLVVLDGVASGAALMDLLPPTTLQCRNIVHVIATMATPPPPPPPPVAGESPRLFINLELGALTEAELAAVHGVGGDNATSRAASDLTRGLPLGLSLLFGLTVHRGLTMAAVLERYTQVMIAATPDLPSVVREPGTEHPPRHATASPGWLVDTTVAWLGEHAPATLDALVAAVYLSDAAINPGGFDASLLSDCVHAESGAASEAAFALARDLVTLGLARWVDADLTLLAVPGPVAAAVRQWLLGNDVAPRADSAYSKPGRAARRRMEPVLATRLLGWLGAGGGAYHELNVAHAARAFLATTRALDAIDASLVLKNASASATVTLLTRTVIRALLDDAPRHVTWRQVAGALLPHAMPTNSDDDADSPGSAQSFSSEEFAAESFAPAVVQRVALSLLQRLTATATAAAPATTAATGAKATSDAYAYAALDWCALVSRALVLSVQERTGARTVAAAVVEAAAALTASNLLPSPCVWVTEALVVLAVDDIPSDNWIPTDLALLTQALELATSCHDTARAAMMQYELARAYTTPAHNSIDHDGHTQEEHLTAAQAGFDELRGSSAPNSNGTRTQLSPAMRLTQLDALSAMGALLMNRHANSVEPMSANQRTGAEPFLLRGVNLIEEEMCIADPRLVDMLGELAGSYQLEGVQHAEGRRRAMMRCLELTIWRWGADDVRTATLEFEVARHVEPLEPAGRRGAMLAHALRIFHANWSDDHPRVVHAEELVAEARRAGAYEGQQGEAGQSRCAVM